METIASNANEKNTSELNVARMLFEKGELQQALEIIDNVVAVNKNSQEAFFLMANIFHRNGEIGKAIRAFTKVLEINPNHTDASISLSVLYNDIGKYEKAKEVFNTAKDKVSATPKRGEPTSALNDPHINKKLAYKHFELADLYVSYSRFDEALFEYNKAIALDSKNLEARIKISKVYAKKGFISKAFDELKRLKNEYPSYMPARLALGILYYGHGKVLEAQTEWHKILEKDPGNQDAHMYLKLSESATETSLT